MRVLLVQRTIDPPGGGNAVAAWMLQALADRHAVSTLTERPWSARAVDDFYGTSLSRATIAQLRPHGMLSAVGRLPGRLDRLRVAVLFREAWRIGDRFDLLMTADNYAAFKRPGIQYVHYPSEQWPTPDRLGALVRLYYRACDGVSGMSAARARTNLTLANSRWTARRLSERFGMASTVLHPPVADPGPGLPWRERRPAFLCVGRFHGSKRFEAAISILSRVRDEFPDVSLDIVGSNVDDEYTDRLRALAARHAWVTMHEDLTQQELFALMGCSRYGIHAMDGEHFGMAPAEMARAGCVVFAHDSGGLVEVVGDARELLWDTPETAVRLITTVLRDERLQHAVRTRLIDHARQFSTARFVHDCRAVVDAWPVPAATTAPPSS